MNRLHSTHEKDELVRVLVKETDGNNPLEEPNNMWKVDIKPNLQEIGFRKNV
jgi:hypothetical protein